jgi:hypothetical protein
MSCAFHALTKLSTTASGLALWAELLAAKQITKSSGAKLFAINLVM